MDRICSQMLHVHPAAFLVDHGISAMPDTAHVGARCLTGAGA